MCGIAGIIARDMEGVSQNTIGTMRKAISYRGRDSRAEWTDEQFVYFLHSRLTVIDLTTGDQPMWDIGQRYVIIYNGEIYNYKELRDEYSRLGAQFQTQSDTEVILEGFKLRGEEICQDLNGMFAFAIWDTKDNQLFLARDRLGKKPLVWCQINDVFYFASTLDAFVDIQGWTGELSMGAIQLYRKIGSFPFALTVYEQARALPPASFAWVSPGKLTPDVARYWQMDFSNKISRSLPQLLEEYGDLLANAISIRLRSDVPVALTFSGGVDSGTIAALCAKRLGTSLACYTIDYHTEVDPSSETIIAEKVARQLGLHWNYIQFDYHTELLANLKRTYAFYDQPCTQLPLVYSQRLYEKIRLFAKVVLSGNGSDELFTGYTGDEAARRQDLNGKGLVSTLQRILKFGKPAPSVVTHWGENLLDGLQIRTGFGDSQFDAIEATIDEIVSDMEKANIASQMDLMMYVRLMFGGSDSNFRLPDISGLAAQVEVRSPYLDFRMVEFAARLPHQFKVNESSSPDSNKYLPKIFYENLVGKEYAWQSKKGMGFNLRWDRSIAVDPSFRDAFPNAFSALDQAGIESQAFRLAWESYTADKLAGVEFPAASGEMMSGFMLGEWLERSSQSLPLG